MVILEAIGIASKEVFDYNRENFKFDQDQRLERETLRLEMQVKRFELFREDVHDLVELTVDRMDVYHLVGALFLEFCIVLFCEGRIQASAPPFLLSLFLLSNACAFIYLLLAVWLSMHASIAAHSFGVRLLTRFVRLPIPSIKQISALKSRLKDYESQGIGNLLRLPGFTDKQEWRQVEEDDGGAVSRKAAEAAAAAEASGSAGQAVAAVAAPAGSRSGSYLAVPSGSAGPELPRVSQSPGRPGGASPPVGTPRPVTLGKPTTPEGGFGERRGSTTNEAPELLAEEMDFPMGGEDLLSGPRGAQPERHIQLFRQLQAKWQCYDAYCRVCMGLGVNQILQGLSYYCICHTLVENHSPTTGYALVVLFQCTTIALAVLDLAGMKRREIIAVQVVGIMPCMLSAWGVAHGMRDANGVLDPEQKYYLSPLSFLCQVLWLELWLRVAAPSCDQAKLPRRFRQVLFLDVFGDAEGWDPMQAENEDAAQDGQDVFDGSLVDGALNNNDEEDRAAEEAVDAAAQQASTQLTLVQCALRRWRAVPDWTLSVAQRGELERLMERLKSWGHTIASEIERRSSLTQQPELAKVFESELRSWQDLSAEERQADPFAKCLVGAFEHDMGYESKQYYYDVEGGQTIFEDTISKTCPGALVLSLDAVAAIMQDLEQLARQLLELRITRDLHAARRRQQLRAQEQREQGKPLRKRAQLLSGMGSRRCVSQKGAFPNLVSLFQQQHLPQRRSDAGSTAAQRRAALDREQGVGLLGGSPTTALPRAASAPAVSLPVASGSGAGSHWEAEELRRPGQAPQQDQTLVAMAGQHAQHFVPERLPWQVLSRMTRVLQICWFYTGIMALLKELQVYQVDYQQHPGHAERRLCVASPWGFEQVDVEWPHGEFFRPRGLACLPNKELAVGSPFAFYRAAAGSSSGPRTWQLEELERLQLPQGTTAMCAAGARGTSDNSTSLLMPCLLAALGSEGVAVWPAGSRHHGAQRVEALQRTIPVDGEAWKLLTGAIVQCSRVASLLLEEEEGTAEWCLLAVGWDGELLPVAAVPLPSAHGWQPAASSRIRPAFDAPLPVADAARHVQALHLEPQRGRLWAVLAGGDLLAWDILQGRSLGRWRPQWPLGTNAAFRPAAICEDPARGLLFALGRGPLLARARVPEALLEASGAAEVTTASEDSEALEDMPALAADGKPEPASIARGMRGHIS